MSKPQQQPTQPTATKTAPTPASTIPFGLTPAWFTDRELLELRKVCRDHEGELAERFLREALRRADRSL